MIIAVFADQYLLTESLFYPLLDRLDDRIFLRCSGGGDVGDAMWLTVVDDRILAAAVLEVASLVQELVRLELSYACFFSISALLDLLPTVVPLLADFRYTLSAVLYDRLSAHWYVDEPLPAKWADHGWPLLDRLLFITVVLEELPRHLLLAACRSAGHLLLYGDLGLSLEFVA